MLARRDLLRLIGLGGVSSIVSTVAWSSPTRVKKSLRLVYMTDAHVPTTGKNDLFLKALQMAQSKAIKPDLIVFGGDNVMAVDGASEADAIKQFNNWRLLVDENVKVPWISCIGNHDVWRWPSDTSNPKAGKAWPVEVFKMPNRYFSREFGGWNLIALDTVHPSGGSYFGELDAEQMDWLTAELDQRRKPTMVFGHIPLVSITGILNSSASNAPNWSIPISWNCKNAREIASLFHKNPHVKLALSGHMHQVDFVKYENTTYLCAGAVSGGWWNGQYERFDNAFVVIDLFEDGTSSAETVFWHREPKKP